MHGNTKTNLIRSGLKATTVTSQAAVLCRELCFSVTNKIIYLPLLLARLHEIITTGSANFEF